MIPQRVHILSELWHVDALQLSTGDMVIAFDPEIEELLTAKGVPYLSGEAYRPNGVAFRDAAYSWATQVMENPLHPFLTYKEVPLGHVYFYPLYLYFCRLAYWLDAVSTVLERNPDTKALIVYPSSHTATDTTGDLAQEEIEALADAALFLGEKKGLDVSVLPLPPQIKQRTPFFFIIQRRFFGYVLGVWNVCMSLRRRRPVRILISDYWRNLSPLLPYTSDVELIFIDRLQALQAGAVAMWRYCIRFYHLDHFTEAAAPAPTFSAATLSAVFKGINIGGLLEAARRALVEKYVPRARKDIDGAYALMHSLTPSVIMLRVSTAPQRHYAILAWVGRALGVPSVEFQHGLEYNGEDSYTRRKSATHLGSYGPKVTKELVAAGIASDRVINIGSPRFDLYAAARKQRSASGHAVFSVLCLYPDLSYGDGFDAYDVDAYVKAVSDAVRTIPGARVTFKLRGPRREAFARHRIAYHCAGVQYDIVMDEPLVSLFEYADVVVSPYSTAVLEAMQSGVPVVACALLAMEQRLYSSHFGSFTGLPVVHDVVSLSKNLQLLSTTSARIAAVSKADDYMSKAYCFDGEAASRAAALLVRLARESAPRYSKTETI